MKKRTRDYLPGVVLVLAAMIIFWTRTNKSVEIPEPRSPDHIQVMGINDQGSFIDENYFRKHVWKPNQDRFQYSLIQMIVFVDPATECPSSLFETEIWAQLANAVDPSIFDLNFFMPYSVTHEMVASYAETFALRPEQIHFFEPDSKSGLFARMGLFKIIWSLESGLMWCEHGSSSPYEHQKTRVRLENLLAPLISETNEHETSGSSPSESHKIEP